MKLLIRRFFIFDVWGWIGMVMVLLTYFLLSLGKIEKDILYQLMNLIGGILMAVGLFYKNVWFSFYLQVIWAVIAFVSVTKILKK